jgi:hypothetical protein
MTADDVEFGEAKVMGDIINPVEGNSFVDLVEAKDTRIFVDKTDFINRTNALLNTDGKLLSLTRPRRFGKTVTADMLLAYYSKEYDGQKIFDNLKITNNEYKASYEKNLNKYDVIYIDMNSIRDDYIAYTEDEELQVKGVTTIVDYLQYSVIEELKENGDYANILSESRKVGKKNLSSALKEICNHTKEQFILIMDEWDLIYRDYRNDTQLQESFIDFLRGLFKGKKGQGSFAFAYLTGILPIKKYNSQSALNGFDEYNMLSPGDYAPYFGFTEDEVANIVKSPDCKVSHQDLKEWYEGYKIKGVDIYNPNSVCKAVSRNECISYWSGTSSNEEFVRIINTDFQGIKEDIINLIEGDEVTFSCANFQNDMVNIKDKNDVFSLLVCLGYLGCSETKNKYRKVAYVPNAEIKAVLMDIVREQNWYERMETIKRSENLLKAIKELDGATVAAIIQEIHNSSAVSLLDYNDEESLTYCVMTGLLWSTLDDYSYHREDQAGNGRVDLVYEPITRRQPLILIEFKYDDSAEEAIKQIKEKEYFKRYAGQYRNIILVGINYSTKTKDHQCLIEKLDN